MPDGKGFESAGREVDAPRNDTVKAELNSLAAAEGGPYEPHRDAPHQYRDPRNPRDARSPLGSPDQHGAEGVTGN